MRTVTDLPTTRRAALPEPLPRPASDSTEPAGSSTLRGYTWWRMAGDGRLESYPGVRWEPGWNEAACRVYPRWFRSRWRRLHPIGVPGAFCVCGFHGSHRPQPAGPGPRLSARLHSGAAGMVFGAVEGAGPTVSDRREWRAAFAQPLALYVPSEHLGPNGARIGRVAERYGVPMLRDFDVLTAIWGPAEERAPVRTA